MCIAAPGQVKKITGQQAWVEYPHLATRAMLGGTSAKVGDFVLVQMGIIIKTLSPREAQSSLSAWQ